jgi:hypothetical protein
MTPLTPCDTTPLFRPLARELVGLLRQLAADDWLRPTVAGEQQSENWMDTGRDYTEHWHHQMQIRDAVGRPRLLEPRWFEPLLDLSVRALPHGYAAVAAADGATVTLHVTGETTGSVVGNADLAAPLRRTRSVIV